MFQRQSTCLWIICKERHDTDMNFCDTFIFEASFVIHSFHFALLIIFIVVKMLKLHLVMFLIKSIKVFMSTYVHMNCQMSDDNVQLSLNWEDN